MKIYNIHGIAPDWCENYAQHGFNEICNTEEDALFILENAKKEITTFLKEEYANGSISNFSIQEHRTYGNDKFLASLSIDVTLDGNDRQHVRHFWEFGTLANSYSGATHHDIKINNNRLSYRLVDLSIHIKELKIETK